MNSTKCHCLVFMTKYISKINGYDGLAFVIRVNYKKTAITKKLFC